MYTSLLELQLDCKKITSESAGTDTSLPQETIDKLITTAVFSTDDAIKKEARNTITVFAKTQGIFPASIKPLYDAFGREEITGFSTPAINIRTLTYDTARLVFRLMKQREIGAVLFELALSESEYTDQTPEEYTACVLAAAIKESYKGPVFLQGDHCQFSLHRYKENKETEIKRLKDWIKKLVNAQFYNIDIDGSTLVDLSLPTEKEQQKENAYVTAELTNYLRSIEPENVSISIGGEIGHIGDKNSTVLDFTAFMELYQQSVPTSGISKISVQTGTTHGGTPSKDGHLEAVKLDFSVLSTVGETARRTYQIGGAVQHGASTLPLTLFHKFPEVQTLEVHLATGLQNIVLDNLSPSIQKTVHTWLEENAGKEKEAGWSDEQFFYKTRKKALGPLKELLWTMPPEEKETIMHRLETYLVSIFEQLHVYKNKDAVFAHFPAASVNEPLSPNSQQGEKSDAKEAIQWIDEVTIQEKIIVMRVDYNVSLNPDHTISDDARIRQSLPTIHHLIKNNNKLILLAHLGQPKGRDKNFTLEPVRARLHEDLPEITVVLVDDFTTLTKETVLKAQKTIFLIENIRFWEGEKENNTEFAQSLASLGDVYVNDAFSVSHRPDASVVGITPLLPSYGGLLLKKEITMLSKAIKDPQKPCVAIMGGAKISSKIKLIGKLTTLADYVLLGGGLANTFLKAKGYPIGKSICEENEIEEARRLLLLAREHHTTLLLPHDVVTAPSLESNTSYVKGLKEVDEKDYILDIGPETQAAFGEVISKAKTIIWNGPMGYFENKEFSRGSDFLYYMITQNSDAFSVVGGGETLAIIDNKHFLDKITHISSGGGAMLEFIENGTLPGIDALKKSK